VPIIKIPEFVPVVVMIMADNHLKKGFLHVQNAHIPSIEIKTLLEIYPSRVYCRTCRNLSLKEY
jgi:hypothetical protein